MRSRFVSLLGSTDPTSQGFYAGGPDDSQVAGVGGVWADADTGRCKFVVSALG